VIEKLGIATLLDAIMDGNDCQCPKPAPDLFLRCAGCLGIAPARCIVVEDAQAGIDAAKAAGMRAIGVGTPEQLSGSYALIANTADFTLEMLA
jgi:HAD superfamily hydrolase (TIGR01509 family)